MQETIAPGLTDAQLYPRLEAFRQELITLIPHKMSARAELEAKGPADLLIAYLNWAYRFVPPRVRQVTYDPDFSASSHYHANKDAIKALETAITAGDNLSPFLSKLPFVKPGYISKVLNGGRAHKTTAWQGLPFDKDSCLNAYELHHLHLGAVQPGAAYSNRTNVVAFVRFSRNKAHFVYLGEHDFHSEGLGQAAARANARRGQILKGIRSPRNGAGFTEGDQKQVESAGLSTTRMVDGMVVIAATQTSSGDSLNVLHQAMHIARTLVAIDPTLNDLGEVQRIFKDAPKVIPPKPRLRWHIQYTELLLCEEETGQCGLVVPGLL